MYFFWIIKYLGNKMQVHVPSWKLSKQSHYNHWPLQTQNYTLHKQKLNTSNIYFFEVGVTFHIIKSMHQSLNGHGLMIKLSSKTKILGIGLVHAFDMLHNLEHIWYNLSKCFFNNKSICAFTLSFFVGLSFFIPITRISLPSTYRSLFWELGYNLNVSSTFSWVVTPLI